MKCIRLASAIDGNWTDPFSKVDGLPLRDSGDWIAEKHNLLTYFGEMFATAMKPTEFKRGWPNRVYIELFSGPGRCLVRETGREELGSPLKIIDQEFTRFIFIDIHSKATAALEKRLSTHPNADKVEIWNGDCREALDQINIPPGSLTFGFIDPTGIAHAPFSLIETLKKKTRGDLLINIQHGMGIKMNLHQYHPDSDADCALTLFLGDDSWKSLLGRSPGDFFRAYLDLYKQKLARIGYTHSRNEVLIKMKGAVPLYLLQFASAHELGQDFWNKAVSGANPQTSFLPLLES